MTIIQVTEMIITRQGTDQRCHPTPLTIMMTTTPGVVITVEKEVKVPRVEKDPRVDTVLLIHGVDTTTTTMMTTTHGVVITVEKEERDPRVVKDPRVVTVLYNSWGGYYGGKGGKG